MFFMFLLTCTKYLKYSIVPPPVASAGTLRAYGQVDNFFRGLFVSKIICKNPDYGAAGYADPYAPAPPYYVQPPMYQTGRRRRRTYYSI